MVATGFIDGLWHSAVAGCGLGVSETHPYLKVGLAQPASAVAVRLQK